MVLRATSHTLLLGLTLSLLAVPFKLYISITSGLETGISKCSQNKRNTHKLNKTNKPWFDQECHKKRKQFFRIKNRLKKSKSFHDRAALNNETKAYKKFINKKSHIYNKNLHKKLRDLKSSKPK